MKILAVAFFSFMMSFATAWAGDVGYGEEDYVVATVDGKDIMYLQVKSIYESSQQLQVMPLETIFDRILEDLITTEALLSAASKNKIEEDPEFKKEFEMLKNKVIAVYYLKKTVEADMTEDKLKKLYKDFLKENPPQEEVKARHILVEKEEEAKSIIEKLKKGADFAEIANEVSEDKGASDGGDLGWFTKDTMVAEFAEEAFKLKKGQFSKVPVKTQFGWHIIKVEDRRKGKPLEFEQVEEMLKAQYMGKQAEEIMNEVKRKAKVKKYGMDGKKVAQ